MRGWRNETDADDDFLDKAPPRSLSLYEGRRESVDPSGPAADADVAVLGAVEVLLEGTTSSLGWLSWPVLVPSRSSLASEPALSKYSLFFEGALVPGDMSESGLLADRGSDGFLLFFAAFSAIIGWRSLPGDTVFSRLGRC